MRYFNAILKQKADIFRRLKFVFRHGSKLKRCGPSSCKICARLAMCHAYAWFNSTCYHPTHPPPPSGGYIPPQTPRCGSVRKWRSGGREFESRSGWRVFFLFPFRKLSTLKKLQTIKSYGKFNGHGKKARQEGFHTANTGEM